MSDDDGEGGIEDIHRDILRLRDRLADELGKPYRRDVLKVGGGAVLAGGAVVAFGGTASADHGGGTSGDVATAAEPALNVFTDTFHFHERTSDPSSPADGTMWYNSSA